jgi:CubicO group peptidase (beta-lactamase class C family)
VCACTGLPRQDWEWLLEFDRTTPSDVMSALAALQPTTRFGATFQYSNQLAAAAGYVAASVLYKGRELGSAYDVAMRERVFAPLDMRQSTFDFARATRGNHAAAHGWDPDGKLGLIDEHINHSMVPLRPAGGLWSSAREMIRYVQLELEGGMVPGSSRRLVSEANLRERTVKQASMGEDSAYGMGLATFSKYGTPIVGHDGGMFGFRSVMFWLPEHNVGAVMLTSSDYGSLLLDAFQRALLEQLFDAKPEALEDLRFAAQNLRKELESERAKLRMPADPEIIAHLAPAYTEPKLGKLSIRGQKLDVGEWQSPLASRSNDDGTTSIVTTAPGINFAFVVGKTSENQRTLTARDAQHEYIFVEAP